MTAMAMDVDGARRVLKEVQNALADDKSTSLTVSRALGGWKPGGRIERDFMATKEEFSKTKFVYLEMSTKHEFVSEIVNGGACEDQKVGDAQQELAERKSNLKKVKSHGKAIKGEVENMLSQTLRKRDELQVEVTRLTELVAEQGTAATQADVAEMEGRILQLQEVLKAQEEAVRSLNTEKQELQVAVRGLEQESAVLAESAEPRPEDMRNRRMGAWLESANAMISKLAGLSAVEVREEEVDVNFEVTAYKGGERKSYTLTLVLGQGHDVGFSEIRLEPADVDLTDLEIAWLSDSTANDLAHLLQEVRNRLSCRLSLEAELAELRTKYSVQVSEEGGAIDISISPVAPKALARSPAKSTAKWVCEIMVDADYPRPHAIPEVRQVRAGVFASPGRKRENALLEAVTAAAHSNVAAIVADVARRMA